MQADVVRRPRLTNLIDRGLRGRLTLIAAPAGSGKSTLVSEWRESELGRDRPFAWLSLDEADSDPTRFFTYFATALDTIRPGIGDIAASLLLSAKGGVSLSEILTVLINEIAEIEDDFVLGLDDYHAISDEVVQEMMASFVEQMPRQMHLLVTSRSEPALPLARLRAHGDLTEIRFTDLQFDGGEAAGMLAASEELDLPPSVVASLTERTEGWAAGLHLFALSVRGLDLSEDELEQRVESFGGSQRFVFDYLAGEIFGQCDEPTQNFLLRTSLLERFTGPLCNNVTGTADGEQMLSRLADRNLFLVPLDDERRWYRYHHLFREFLRARAAESGGEMAVEVHRRAAAWFEEHGIVSEAIDQASAANDHETVARLLSANLDEREAAGQHTSISKWSASLPEEMVRTRPRLAVIYAMSALATENNNQTGRRLAFWAEDALQAIEDAGEFNTSDDVDGTIVGPEGLDVLRGELLTLTLVHSIRSLSPEEVESMTAQALALLPPTKHRDRGMIHMLQLGYPMDRGKMKAALATLERGTEEARQGPSASRTDGFLLSRAQVSVAVVSQADGMALGLIR